MRKKSIFILLYLCISIPLGLFIAGIFSGISISFIILDFNEEFPFSKKEIYQYLKISIIGVPIGLALWFFNYRKL
jgi:hypothetical protein